MSKTSRVEFWDWPPEPKRSRRPRLARVEILPPKQPTVGIDVHRHNRSGFRPQHAVIAVAVLMLLRFAPAIGIAAIVLLALAFTYPVLAAISAIWLACV